MKTMLVSSVGVGANHRTVPLGLAYVSSYLRSKGRDVVLLDANAMTLDAVAEQIARERPDIVGTTALTWSVPKMHMLFDAVKRTNASTVTVVGGPHPTALPAETVMLAPVDIAVMGEGEVTMDSLVGALEGRADLSTVEGIAFKRDGKAVVNGPRAMLADLDVLPFPDWDHLPVAEYGHRLLRRRNFADIVTSRGCPFQCIFCSVASVWGRRVRRRSPGNVIAELEVLSRRHGVRSVEFHDSIFLLSREWVGEFCELFLSRHIDMDWVCNARADTVDADTLRVMKASGCKCVNIGVESGDAEMLKRIKKNEAPEDFKRAFRLIREAGLFSEGSFIVGLPGETLESIRNTIRLMKETMPDNPGRYVFATPLPGSEFHDIAKREGKMDVPQWDQFTFYQPTYVPDGLTLKDLQKARAAFFRQFLVQSIVRPRSLRQWMSGIRLLLSTVATSGPVRRPAIAVVHAGRQLRGLLRRWMLGTMSPDGGTSARPK